MKSKDHNRSFWAVGAVVAAGVWLYSSPDKSSRDAANYESVEMPAEVQHDLPELGLGPLDGSNPSAETTAPPPFGAGSNSFGAGLDAPDPAYRFYPARPIIEDDDEPAPRYFDEREAKKQAERKMARRGYDYSFGCTIDCSGHEAGWQYRAENRYPTYGSNDYGKSQSFAEGAQAYERAVKKEVERARQDFELGNDDYASSYPNF